MKGTISRIQIHTTEDLILGQEIQTTRRTKEAYRWLSRQDLSQARGQHITTVDHFTERAQISVHVLFHSQAMANNFIKSVNGDRHWRPCSTALKGMCARDYLDFTVFVSWEL